MNVNGFYVAPMISSKIMMMMIIGFSFRVSGNVSAYLRGLAGG